MTSTEYLIQMISSKKGINFKTYSELADRAEVSQGNLSNFMSGKKQTITFESVWKIFNCLQIAFPSVEPKEQHPKNHCPELEAECARLRKVVAEQEIRLDELRALLRPQSKEPPAQAGQEPLKDAG